MMGRVAGKTAFVSGAASGIGLATARRLSDEGASLILADRSEAGLAAALSDFPDDQRAVTITMDVTLEKDWQRAAELVGDRFGRLDVLANIAGFGTFRSIEDTTLETWRTIIAVNLDSVFLATKYMLPLLKASGGASIVNMSSIRGIVGGAHASSYSAAKGGVRLLTKCTALECASLGYKVRANSIHPGHVETPLTAATYADPDVAREFLAHTPLARFARPEDIADAILFLASDESAYITGAELVIDGGVTAQ